MNQKSAGYNHYDVDVAPQDPSEVNAFVLEKIAELAMKAKHAIKEKNYESRFKLMDKAHFSLVSMCEGIIETPDNKNLAKAHRNFYNTMIELVRKIDFENSLEACDALESCLKEMASTWNDVGREFQKQQGRGETKPSDSMEASPEKKIKEPLNFSV